MKKILFLSTLFLVSFFLVFSSISHASERTRVSNIRIRGNEAISDATIRHKLKITEGDIFETSALNQELRRLYATGYFEDVFVETNEFPEGMEVVFTVVEKPVVEKIEFEGKFSAPRRRLTRQITTEKGTLLDFNLLSQDISSLKSYLVGEGHADAEVGYRVDTDPETSAVTVVYEINEGLAVHVKSIDFEGNEYFSSRELRRYMATRTKWWFIRKGAFNEETFRSDLSRLRTLYRGEGFMDADVTSEIDYSEDGSEIYITISVEEGKQYLIGDIHIGGQLAVPEEEIRELLEITPGDTFNVQRIREDTEEIRRFYYAKGFMEAGISVAHDYNDATGRMDLSFRINSGEEVYVGMINVLGNTRTKDAVIRREIRVYPGEKYDGEKLRRSKQNIYNLGYFEDVHMDTVSTPTRNVSDLNVQVKETKTGEFSFGGGYSSTDAFIGFAQIRQRNFDATSFPTFTGGGQDLVLRGEIGSARSNYVLSWTDPWILGYPYLFGFDFYRHEHKKFSDSGYDYDETRTGGALRLGKDITDDLSTGLKYNLERVDIGDMSLSASQALRDEQGKNTLSRLEWTVTWDRRDNRFAPSKGWLTGFSLENAGGFMGGDKDFLKGYVHGSYYYSIIENVVLELRGRGGMVGSYGSSDTVPIYERFFAGGATTIRGYEQRAVGPRDTEDKNFSVGGESMLIGNAEVSFPLYRDILKGAVFFDIGSVGAKTSDMFKTSDFKSGGGVGVRLRTPIGPVRLDYGYPFNENHDDSRKGHFYFSVSHGF